jgi:hypothetical protein
VCVPRLAWQVCLPFFDMIRRWVFEGLLEDPHQEFFITRTALVEVCSSSGAKVAGAPGEGGGSRGGGGWVRAGGGDQSACRRCSAKPLPQAARNSPLRRDHPHALPVTSA